MTTVLKLPEELDLLPPLDEGQRLGLSITYRLFRKNRGFLSIFGNTLVLKKQVNYIGFKDFFEDHYVFQSSDGLLKQTKNKDEFLSDLCYLTSEIAFTGSSNYEYFVQCKVILNPVILDPPLHIIKFFSNISLERESEPVPIFP